MLNSIDVPTLVIFGDEDECVLTQPIDIVNWYLKNNLRNCSIQTIEGADHLFTCKYEELENIIRNNM
jgi:pimeloyl-ACP methyl ester carboxylesterase